MKKLMLMSSALALFVIGTAHAEKAFRGDSIYQEEGEEFFGEWQIYPSPDTKTCTMRRYEMYGDAHFHIEIDFDGDYFFMVLVPGEARDPNLKLPGTITFDRLLRLNSKVTLSENGLYFVGFYKGEIEEEMRKATKAHVEAGTTTWWVSMDGSSGALDKLDACIAKLKGEPSS